jgi:hypothetical protein
LDGVTGGPLPAGSIRAPLLFVLHNRGHIPAANGSSEVDIHKPKPIHNWRELASEIGVIVTGIIIALSGEQFLERLEWRHKIQLGEQQMRFELSEDDGPEVMQRLALADCIDHGLADIRATVERTGDRAAAITAIGRFDIPRHTYESDAYRAAAASGVLARLDPQRLDRWNFTYATMPVLDRIAEREYFDAVALHAVRTSGAPLSEAEQLKLLDALESLRRDNLDIVREAGQAAQGLKEQAVILDRPRMRVMMDELKRVAAFEPCAARLTALAGYEP